MSEALGDFIYSKPIEQDGDEWSGHIVSRGAKVIKFTTYYECDLITYKDSDIVETLTYEGDTVHKLWYQNIIKIEGVY